MQPHIIPVKQIDDIVITTSNILWKINYQNSHQYFFLTGYIVATSVYQLVVAY